jgi:pimeloyl-ACP methyl ester carboxylesterase
MPIVNRLSFVAPAVALIISLAGCQTVQQPDWQLPPGVKTLTTNGYPMAYVERGAGPTIVLVHGSLNDYRYWTRQLEILSSRFRVVSVSLRHYYPERWNGVGNFGLEQHAADVAVLIEKLNTAPVYLVGWSRGGQVVVRTALARPELVRKLLLMDPALTELAPPLKPASGEDVVVARAKATEVYYRKGDIAGGLEFFFDGVNGKSAWKRLTEVQRQFRLENAWTVVGQAADGKATPISCDDIGKIQIPVLLMTGDKSPPHFRPILDAYQRCQPAAARMTIPNAAHQMSQMNPAAVNAAITKFFLE